AFDDAKLVSYAYAHEQTAHPRRAPARTPALGGALSVPLIRWQSTAKAPGPNGRVSAKFALDRATNELTYNVTVDGFPEGEILAATIHRITKGDSGPVISVLSNHAFQSISGT